MTLTASMVSPDFEIVDRTGRRGLDALLDVWAEMDAAFDDVRYSVEEIVDLDDRGVAPDVDWDVSHDIWGAVVGGGTTTV